MSHPSPEEAAAIMAALEHFFRDTAPVGIPRRDRVDPWAKVSILEGVLREERPSSATGMRDPWKEEDRSQAVDHAAWERGAEDEIDEAWINT